MTSLTESSLIKPTFNFFLCWLFSYFKIVQHFLKLCPPQKKGKLWNPKFSSGSLKMHKSVWIDIPKPFRVILRSTMADACWRSWAGTEASRSLQTWGIINLFFFFLHSPQSRTSQGFVVQLLTRKLTRSEEKEMQTQDQELMERRQTSDVLEWEQREANPGVFF